MTTPIDPTPPPFKVQVADRVKRLPPYLFGRINALKYQKRRAGDDVIDLGMGNPTDPPQDIVIDKLAEAARDSRNHGYSQDQRHRQPAPRGGRQVLPQVRRAARSRERGDRLPRLEGRLQPHVPGPAGPRRHGDRAGAVLSRSTCTPSRWRRRNVIALEVANSDKFLSNIAYTCEHLYPRPKLLILNYPHNPSSVVGRAGVLRRGGEARPALRLHGHQRLRLRRRGFDGYQPPSFLASPGATEVGVEFTTMSKGYNMAGWRVGFCCGNAEMVRALATIKGYYDYGMFQAIQIAAIVALRHTDAAVEEQSPIYQGRRDVLCDGLRRLGWDVDAARAGMFVWAPIPEPWRQPDEHDGLRHEAARRRATWPSAPAAASARPAKATCGWRWSRTRTGCGRPCGRSRPACARPKRRTRRRRRRHRHRRRAFERRIRGPRGRGHFGPLLTSRSVEDMGQAIGAWIFGMYRLAKQGPEREALGRGIRQCNYQPRLIDEREPEDYGKKCAASHGAKNEGPCSPKQGPSILG